MGDQVTDREQELQEAPMDVQLKDSATAGEASASSGGVDIGRLFPEETLQLAFEAARGEATVKVTDEEVASAADELYRLEPNHVVRERSNQLAGTSDAKPSKEVWEDYAKMLNGDVNAYVRVLKATGQEPGPNDVYDFRARGGLPLLQALRAATLAGSDAVDPGSPLGRRLAENEKDFEKAQRGDREALRRIANRLGLPHSDMQKLLRAVAGGRVAIGSGSSGNGSSGDGSGTGGVTSGAGDPPEAKQARDPWTPPERRSSDEDPLTPPGSGGDADNPGSNEDPDPGRNEDNGGGDTSTPPDKADGGSSSGSSSKSGSGAVVEVGEGKEVPGGQDGARATTDENGNTTVYYPDGRVEVYDANGNKVDEWTWDPDAVDDAGRPTDEAVVYPEMLNRVTWSLFPERARPPVRGDRDPVNPEWGGESGGTDVIVVVDTVIDPLPPEFTEGSGGGALPAPRGPDYGNPEILGDPGDLGPLDPDGPAGGTDPVAFPARGGFSRAARFAGRAAVTVGLAAGGFLLGSALADRNGAADANRSDTPAISESGGSTKQNTDTAAGQDAGASGPLVEGRGDTPSEQQTRRGAEPATRLADDVSSPDRGRDLNARVPSERSPSEGPSRPDGSSSDLDREPDPDFEFEPEGGSGPDGGLESGSGDLQNEEED